MDICVLPRVGSFRLGKFVFMLSNKNKWTEVAFTHIHEALCTLLHSVFCPIMLTTSLIVH